MCVCENWQICRERENRKGCRGNEVGDEVWAGARGCESNGKREKKRAMNHKQKTRGMRMKIDDEWTKKNPVHNKLLTIWPFFSVNIKILFIQYSLTMHHTYTLLGNFVCAPIVTHVLNWHSFFYYFSFCVRQKHWRNIVFHHHHITQKKKEAHSTTVPKWSLCWNVLYYTTGCRIFVVHCSWRQKTFERYQNASPNENYLLFLRVFHCMLRR